MKKIRINKIIKLILLSFVIELILSNITYFNLLACDGKNTVANFWLEDNEIEYKNVDLNLVIDTQNIQIQNVKIYFKDQNKLKNIINYEPNVVMSQMERDIRVLSPKYEVGNKNIKININSENKTLQLNLNILGLTDINEIEKIIINDTHIEFSIVRFLLICALAIFIYLIKSIDKNLEYDYNNKKMACIFYGIIIMIVVLILLEFHANGINMKIGEKQISSYSRNFLNAQAEAILNHQLDLSVKTDDIFYTLENPFDLSSRLRLYNQNNLVESEANHVDYSYYNGKFYSYFGIAPLIFILPFKLITGYYVDNFTFNFIIFIIMLFVLAKLYQMLVKRYVKNVTFLNFILGFLTVIFSSTIFILCAGGVYEIEIISALIFTMLSYIFILSIYDNPNRNLYKKIFGTSICMGLIVLSKPSFICYYIFLFYLLIGLRKKLNKQKFINCIKVFILPISICAIFQMWWNYIRFDSVFNFGEKYQITVLQMQSLQYVSPMKLLEGLLKVFFMFPSADINNFPFLFMKDLGWINYDINIISYTPGVIGICIIPIFWIYFFLSYIKKKYVFSNDFYKDIKVLIITSLILLCIDIRNGVAEHYILDVKIFLYIFAVIMYLKIIEKEKDSFCQKLYTVFCIVSIFMILPIDIGLGMINWKNINTNFIVYLKNIFEFWM